MFKEIKFSWKSKKNAFWRNQLGSHICCRMLMNDFISSSQLVYPVYDFVKKLEFLKRGKTEKLGEGSVNHKNYFILLIGMLSGLVGQEKRGCLPAVLLEYLFWRSTLWDLIVNWKVIFGFQTYFSVRRQCML